jgi:GT2 family glycosyltransferase/2-polyprenyl-3-methyl-5-hydroxy-6-metoxy-1,4-benzoquinol methylase
MHQSSYSIITRFRDLVEKHFQNDKIRILDVGSYGVNGTYKEIFSDTNRFNYLGLDVTPGPNVDYVPQEPYCWPELENESFDVIISGQAFEHIEFPWLIVEEMSKKLKKNGLICIVAPSRGPEHKYPVDCWRYYPDGFRALAKWVGLEVLEAKTSWGASGFSDGSDQWGDTFCILYKPNDFHGAIKHKRPERRSFAVAHRNNPLRSDKKSSYYGFARNEVVDLLVSNKVPAVKVLEIGCAGGATGRSLKEKIAVSSYVGVELSQEAAEMARQHLDKVIVADIERTDLQNDHGLKHGEFDLLIALDVLEHLYDPWDALKELANFVRPCGHIVVSIPNVQNISVLQELIKGKWHYEDAGILDATHLRFFTLEESEKLIGGAGLTIKTIDKVLNPPLDMSQLKDSGNRFKQGNLEITDLSKDDITNLFTYQFIVIAQKEAMATDILSEETQAGAITTGRVSDSLQAQFQQRDIIQGLTSIVILTYNQLEYTKKCIKSIRKHTPEPHEIIFVDNGSTDDTIRWLGKIVRGNNNYVLVQNTTNLGFAKGCNQGIEASKGEYILLLNNDVIVVKNWLSGLLECLNSAADTGIVGPMTNNISGPQQVISSEYRSVDYLDEYAAQFRQKNRHRRIPLRRIVGFCMLFRRILAEKIGLLDESFGSGNFEDDDYCYRTALAGYQNIIAGDVFIHHYGSRSFIGNKIHYAASLSGNRRKFDEKWSGISAASELGKKLIVLNAVEQALRLYEMGELDKAVEKLVDAIKHAPGDVRIYYCFAEIFIEAKKYQEALGTIQSIPEAMKNSVKTLVLTGYCKEGMELYTEALEYADLALSLNPRYAPGFNLKGIVAYKQGNKTEAERYFKEAIEIDPGYGEPYTNLGVLEWAAERQNESLNLLEKGFILSPHVSDITTLYHSAITAAESYERAEQAFKDAGKFYPYNKKIYFLLIDVLLKQNKNEDAMREIEKAMITFGIDDGILAAALAVRGKLGPKELGKTASKESTLSVCMIVKNEEDHIAKCLMSVKPVADEMIVVDTGSSDGTKDTAAAFGAKVYDFEWTGDFSAARNYSLSQASGDWILVLDADEVISPLDYELMRELISKKYPKPVAYSLITRNYTNRLNVEGWIATDGKYDKEEAGNGWYPSEKVRLIRNDKRIHFVNPVHECVEPTIIEAGIEIKPCSIPVHHYGRLGSREKIQAKREAYYLLGKEKLEEKGNNDPKALYELALAVGELEKYEEAIELWERFIKLEPNVPSAFINLGSAYMKLGRHQEALDASKKAVDLDPDSKEAVINYASCMVWCGDIKIAIPLLEKVARKVKDYVPAGCLLATAHCINGDAENGGRYLNKLKKKGYNTTAYLCEQAQILRSLGRIEYVRALLETALRAGHASEEMRQLLEEL